MKLTNVDAVFKDIGHWEESSNSDHPPDIVLYSTNSRAAAAAYRLNKEAFSTSQPSKARKPHVARCAYPWMITAIKVEKQGAETGFGFEPGEPLLFEGREAAEARSYFAAQAADIMLRQHRTHLYTFYVVGWWARVFYWDRVGTIVSDPIDLRTDSRLVLNLIYRLVLSDESTQGFDTTATLASEADISRLRAYNTDNTYLAQHKSTILDSADEYPIFKVRFLFAI